MLYITCEAEPPMIVCLPIRELPSRISCVMCTPQSLIFIIYEMRHYDKLIMLWIGGQYLTGLYRDKSKILSSLTYRAAMQITLKVEKLMYSSTDQLQ